MISLLTPVHNTPVELLRPFIHSIKTQTCRDWELCIANDCSTSGETIEFLNRLREDKTINVKIIDLPEQMGIGAATQKAFEISSGEHIAFADSDDELHPQAFEISLHNLEKMKADMVYSDESVTDMNGNITIPHFKADYSYDSLLSQNYICHFVMLKKHIYIKAGGLRSGFDGSQDHDFLLRVSEVTNNIYHIPEILYYWRSVPDSITHNSTSKSNVWDRGVRAIQEHLERRNRKAMVQRGNVFGSYVVKYEVIGNPLVSIIIPFKNDVNSLNRCISKIEQSTYNNKEIIIVNNDRANERKLVNFKDRAKIENIQPTFNYSKFLNIGVNSARGDYVITMHDDAIPVHNDWIETMLGHAQRPEIGVVGAKLITPNKKNQNVGYIIGIGGFMAPQFPGIGIQDIGYFCRAVNTQNISAVSGACMMFKKELYHNLGGFDENNFTIDYSDVDFCLRALKNNYKNIMAPPCLVEHIQKQTRGTTLPIKQKNDAHFKDTKAIKSKHFDMISAGDPYYNKNLLKTAPYAVPAINKNKSIGHDTTPPPKIVPTITNIETAPPDPDIKKDKKIITRKEKKEENPLVSIIVPVFDHYPIVVPSLLLQTYQNFEIVVVHDGPIPEDFKKTIKGFNSNKIKVFNTEKRFDDWGHTPRSLGLEKISNDSKFIVFTGADNYYVPKFLELMLEAFTTDRVVAAYCNLLHNYWDWILVNTKLTMGSIDCGCVMVRAGITKSIGWKHRKHIADWMFMEELIKRKGTGSIVKVPKILFVHN